VKKKPKRRNYRDEELIKQVGANLRKARLERDITIENLANEIGVDYSQINRMELGKVNFTISNLYRIAAVLKTDPKKLLP